MMSLEKHYCRFLRDYYGEVRLSIRKVHVAILIIAAGSWGAYHVHCFILAESICMTLEGCL